MKDHIILTFAVSAVTSAQFKTATATISLKRNLAIWSIFQRPHQQRQLKKKDCATPHTHTLDKQTLDAAYQTTVPISVVVKKFN